MNKILCILFQFLKLFLELFLRRLFAVTKLYFDFQTHKFHTCVQLVHEPNLLSYLLVLIFIRNIFEKEYWANVLPKTGL